MSFQHVGYFCFPIEDLLFLFQYVHYCGFQIEDSVFEIIAEDFIKDEVIESELEEEVPEIAKSVLSHYDSKVMKRELKEVQTAFIFQELNPFHLKFIFLHSY